MFKNRTIEAAFPSGIWQQDVEGAETLNEELRGHIAAIPNKVWIENVWQSEDTLHQRTEFDGFCELALAACHDVLKFMKMDYEDVVLTGCWANMYRKSGIGPHHTHPNNYLSGVYYVDAPADSGQLKFVDPRPQAGMISPQPREFTNFNSGSLFIEAKEGKMVVFHSWLPHAVMANKTSEVRTSIAFNAMFRGKLGGAKAAGSF